MMKLKYWKQYRLIRAFENFFYRIAVLEPYYINNGEQANG